MTLGIIRIMIGYLFFISLYSYPMRQNITPYSLRQANHIPVNRSMYAFDIRYRRLYEAASGPQTNPFYRDQLFQYEQSHPNRYLHALVNNCGYIAAGCLSATACAAGAAFFFYVVLQNASEDNEL